MDIEHAIGQKLLLAFAGKYGPTGEAAHALRAYRPAGVTLFRSLNVESPFQVCKLTTALQSLARDLGLPPLLIAADQEGGQLLAIGEGTTPLPGNMALGATGSADLTRRAGEVLGRELAAMGVNVDYAPCADVNVNPQNPVVGVRSFGEDAAEVARLTAAMVQGIQAQGVAATAKHFPGHGDTSSDSHLGLPAVPHDLERLQAVEFPPFRAAIDSGAKLIMSAHLALPALDGPQAPPATLSTNILQGLLRERLGFSGVIVTDAMDMHAIRQGEFLGAEAVRAARAGADLLLITADPQDQERVYRALVEAVRAGKLDPDEIGASADRVLSLKAWLARAPTQPDLSVVGCAEHRRVAQEIAERSITLVRDRAGLLPLRLEPGQRVGVIIPRPQDLTPADTSSYVTPTLAAALCMFHPNVDEFVVPYAPGEADIAAIRERAGQYDLLVAGTLNASREPGQQALVGELLKTGVPVVVVAMRLPYDLAAFPEAPTYVCTYGILEPSMQALARALFGQIEMEGRLPVTIPGIAPRGYRWKE